MAKDDPAKVAADGDDQDEIWPLETDSVDAQFGGEYSEETLRMVRGYPKPTWLEEPSSLDPIEDLEVHAEHDLRIPPTTYAAVQQAADEEIAEILAGKDLRLGPEELDLIQYRKDLVDGTSLDDMKLLKLRAYHRAMDELNAGRAELRMPEARRKLMEQYGVPLDKVPQELIDMTPEQLADRWRKAQRRSDEAAAAAVWSDYSEDSEWGKDWSSRSYLHCETARREMQEAFAPLPAASSASATAAAAAAANPWGEFGKVLLNGDPDKVQVWKPFHEYTPEYLQQQQASRQLRSQQRQRALAFWLPLATVLGTYVVKGVRHMLLRKRRRQKPGGDGVDKLPQIRSGQRAQV